MTTGPAAIIAGGVTAAANTLAGALIVVALALVASAYMLKD